MLNNVAQIALKARKWRWLSPQHPPDDSAADCQHVEDVEVVAERVVEQPDVVNNEQREFLGMET